MTAKWTAQTAFRGRDDTQTLNSSTFNYNQNTNWSQDVDTTFRVRFEVEEQNNKNTVVTGGIEYQLNTGGWNTISTTSSVVIAVASSQSIDEVATTDILTVSGKSFIAGVGCEDAVPTSVAIQNEQTEWEYSLQIVGADVNNGDSVEIRLVGLDEWTAGLTITAQKASTASDSNPAFTDGKLDATPDSTPAYLYGAIVATPSAIHGYIGPPVGYPVDNSPAYLIGSMDATPSNKYAYLRGSADDEDNNPAYLVGGIGSVDNQSAYMEGYMLGGDVDDSSPAFTLGLDNWLVPDSDLSSSGVWRNELDSESNIYLSIDEAPTPIDSDYIWNTDPTTGYYYECTLTNPIGTPGDGDVVILWRGRDKTGSGNAQATIQLRQGAAVIGSDTQILPLTATTFYFMLTSGEKASITDWNDLRLRFNITIL